MPNPLKASYQFLAWMLDHDQVPNDIRRSLELVRTCDLDLQHLIELRNDCIHLLKRRPKVLQRVHTIIESAQKGLQEVCEIVEKCRPENDRGSRTTFSKRMAWVLVEASEFKSQEPIVSRHHAAVLAELNFLRQIALMAPIAELEEREEKRGTVVDATVFDNVALLGDLLGDLPTYAPEKKQPETQTIAPQPPIIVLNANTKPVARSEMPSPQVPAPLQHKPSSQILHIEHASDSLPEVLPVNITSVPPSRSLTTSSKYDTKDLVGLSLLLGDPLDFENGPTPSPEFQREGMKRATTVPAPYQASPYGPPRSQSVYSQPNQRFSYNPEDSVSDLSQSSRNSYRSSSTFSNISNPLHHRPSSLSVSSSATEAPIQQCHSCSNHYPSQFVWTNSSSTTISMASPYFHGNNFFPSQPIAELGTSPYQMVPIIDAPIHHDQSGQTMAVQVNTTPVELSAEETQATKPSLRRQTIRLGSSRRGRTLSDPVSSLQQQGNKRL
ncbi:unnamed protein product [Fusarium graminearum]|uniref:Uncharacterized protein n=1 Tax=Gibberella zeae TaxID=5518 RepID=A0A2H3G1G6_GIBZA|nr:hypothetical protein HG531_006129 [Fusarium graminearum]PCD19103.1 hypothetical protein FGRA07_05908 [Fusarium graminearum]CAG1975923.1 unnamed protein product [Fusarium graminearum]CAG2000481.1 unnamed protein product [Fusarium graminearum]CAG2007646.1 unnamed protein product [Fusarium graminearum]